MTTDEFYELDLEDVVQINYNGITAEYVVSAKDEHGVQFSPLSGGFSIRYDSCDKWKLSNFTLKKKAKKTKK